MGVRERLFRLQWTYLRGWIAIGIAVFLVRLLVGAFARVSAWLEPFFSAGKSTAVTTPLAVVVLLVVPWALGWATQVPVRLFRKQRSTQAFQQMEKRLSDELRPGASHGYRVALINWPNKETQTLAVVSGIFRQHQTGRDLATVYLPGTPDPTKGWIRVVAVDDLTLTDWSMGDLARLHVTLGAAIPASTGEEEIDPEKS